VTAEAFAFAMLSPAVEAGQVPRAPGGGVVAWQHVCLLQDEVMKALVLSALVSLVAAVPLHAADSPFDWKVPEGWKLTVDEKIQFHSFMIGGGGGVMMFSKWPAPTKPEDISKTLKEMAGKFAELVKTKGVTLKKDEATFGEIKGVLFEGSYALFEMKVPEDFVQTMYLVHDGKGNVFNGQFTGKATDWEKGLEMLKTAKAK
jgi:hypothetical protein